MSDKETQTSKILRLLKQNGEATNYELNKIAFRYGARIMELRKEGHIIISVHEKGSLWRFVYKGVYEHAPSKPVGRLTPTQIEQAFTPEGIQVKLAL